MSGTGAGRRGMPLRGMVCALIATVLTVSVADRLSAQESDEEAVLAAVRTLFEGMRDKDGDMISSALHEGAELKSAVRDREGNPRVAVTPMDGFVANVVSAEGHLDEVIFDERILVDGDLAMAWTPYNFFLDGNFSHCGVNLFVLTRTDEGWKILSITDTRRREGCDPERRG